jgi:multiple sugar transport system ATP-binding protein
VAEVSFRGVEKVFDGGVRAVDTLDLEVADGELLVLLGPSGCGKTTVLRLLAGLETPTGGEIHVGGRRVDQLPPADRDVAMIFQDYALYPHKTVAQNLQFPLRMRGVRREDREGRVREVAELLDIDALLEKRPGQLSGGQQQRVAIGRALVREPAAFLMDEPLSNLDAQLRARIRTELGALQHRLGITTLFVTHDQGEAMTLGHRVAVMREGRLLQVGTPDALYAEPADVFVASFVGEPSINVLDGRLERADGAWSVLAGGARLALSDFSESQRTAGDDKSADLVPEWKDAVVTVGLRPEALRLTGPDAEAAFLTARVRAVETLGHDRLVHLEHGDIGLVARIPRSETPPGVGERVGVAADAAQAHLFGRDGRRLIPWARASA